MNIFFIYDFLADLGYTHPLHPAITHLSIGLVMGALIFHLIALLPRYGKYAATARHCGTLAFLGIFPTIILGLMDWSYYYGSNWIFPIQMKLILAGALALLLFLAIILNAAGPPRSGRLLLIYLLSFASVAGLGYYGGEIVFGKSGPRAAEAQTRPGKSMAEDTAGASVNFADVQNIIQNNCTNCHAGANPPKGLDLSSYKDIMQGSRNGPVVVAGKPGKSELIKRVKGLSVPQMPPSGPALSPGDIRILEKWVHAEAPGPKS